MAGRKERGGTCSCKDGAIYHHKAYVHIPGGRKGLLKVLGGGPSPFATKTLAPADADLAMEMALDAEAGSNVPRARTSAAEGSRRLVPPQAETLGARPDILIRSESDRA